jgi:sensor domain CHASE-containing protein
MKRKRDFLLQNVGGQDLLVPLGSKVRDMNCLITLNATGRCVWELLAENHSLEDLATELAERFNIDRQKARSDVEVFLEDIGRLGLLET